MIAITQGDPAGIGPEIIVEGWKEIVAAVPDNMIVFGHPEILRQTARLRNLDLTIAEVKSVNASVEASSRVIPCLKVVDDSAVGIAYGQVDARGGKAAYEAIDAAIEAAKAGQVAAIVTAPIHKEAMNLAGYHYPGHTELLAEKCGVADFAMMLYLALGSQASCLQPGRQDACAPRGLAVAHVTLHTAMRNVFDEITIESVLQKSRLIHEFMLKIKRSPPRIGVCSLNPHAGENGLFGDEEIRIIGPAVELARREGLDIEGPLPADTIMVQAQSGRFDAVVAMFHDQGHIALKLLGMNRAVNITLGLPIIRTSVAHGTAFDLAGKGVADPGSLVEAVHVAFSMTERIY